jgi:hypothetical protein
MFIGICYIMINDERETHKHRDRVSQTIRCLLGICAEYVIWY